MREIAISKAQEGQRLDRFLGKCLPQASGGFLHKMLRKKNIKLNGQKADGNEKLKGGDVIQIFFSDETFDKFSGAEHKEEKAKVSLNKEQRMLRDKVKVLYHDQDIVILHKPAGMLSQKSAKSDDSLNDYLLDLCQERGWIDPSAMDYFRPSVANRLDRNTSGIVLCGISTKGLQTLSQTLRDRSIRKYYLAIVKGQVSEGRKIKGYLRKDEEKNIVSFSRTREENSVPIETEYRVMRSSEKASLLKIRLITGKSHQIRAHLASEGYPILGDYKYGDRNTNQILKNSLGISYQMLHSYEIDFGEYFDGRVIKDPIPKDFARAMELFELQ